MTRTAPADAREFDRGRRADEPYRLAIAEASPMLWAEPMNDHGIAGKRRRWPASLALATSGFVAVSGCYRSVEPHDPAGAVPDASIPDFTLSLVGMSVGFVRKREAPLVGARVIARRCDDGEVREGTSDAAGIVHLAYDAVTCWTLTVLSPDGRTAFTFLDSPPPDGPLHVGGAGDVGETFSTPRAAPIVDRLAPGSTVRIYGSGAIVGSGGTYGLELDTSAPTFDVSVVDLAPDPFVVAVEYDAMGPVQAVRVPVSPDAPVSVVLPGVADAKVERSVRFELPVVSAVNPFGFAFSVGEADRVRVDLAAPFAVRTADLTMFEVRGTHGNRALAFVAYEPSAFEAMAGLGDSRARATLIDAKNGIEASFVLPFQLDRFGVLPVDALRLQGARARTAAYTAGGTGYRASLLLSAFDRASGRAFTSFVTVPDGKKLDLSGLPPYPTGSELGDAFATLAVDAALSLVNTQAFAGGTATVQFTARRSFGP